MAYKIYVKKLSSYEKKRKQARQERRQAKRLRSTESLELTKDQIDEMYHAAVARLHSRVRTLVETDCPELLSLVGSDLNITKQNFAEVGRLDTLMEMRSRCEKELEQLLSIAFLSIATQPLKGTTE